jgi:hypothetical protein
VSCVAAATAAAKTAAAHAPIWHHRSAASKEHWVTQHRQASLAKEHMPVTDKQSRGVGPYKIRQASWLHTFIFLDSKAACLLTCPR